MMLPRFFYEGSISTGALVALPDTTSHHLARVLRLSITDRIVLFNGLGGEYECAIQALGKKRVDVLPESFCDTNRDSPLKVHLGISVLKKDAMDRVIAKSTEMGVETITPVIAEHSTVAKKIINNRHAHWHQVILSACEQCGLNIIPTLEPAKSLQEYLKSVSAEIKLISLGSGQRFDPKGPTKEVALLVGPEGGFAQHEILNAQTSGFNAVKFGPRVLRAETAPIVAVSALRYALEED